MTALAGYVRLESEGRFRTAPDGTPVSVLVKFGDASLMIMSFDEEPITHWPLASLTRKKGPAPGGITVTPDNEAPERLEIDDADMVAAISAVCDGRGPALPPQPVRRRWPRRVAAIVSVAMVLGAAAVFSPHLLDRLAENLPDSARANLGVASLSAYAGSTRCSTPAGDRALVLLARQLAGPDGVPPGLMVAVLPPGAPDALGGAGRQVLLAHRVVLAAARPADLAEPVAQALAEARAATRTAAALRSAGVGAISEVLTGNLAGPRLTAAAVAGLNGATPPGTEIETAKLAHLAALDRDAIRLQPSEWLALRQICGR